MISLHRHALFAGAAIACVASAAPAYAQTRTFDVAAQPAESGIAAFGRQANIQIVAARRYTRGKRTNAVKGELAVQAALAKLLEGTGLVARATGPQTYMIVPRSADDGPGAVSAPIGINEATPEILVVGQRSINVDIRRSETGAQPYAVLDREQIEGSNATSVEDFLRTRLSMNATSQTNSAQGTSTSGNRSAIDLRGLGTAQTLILLDGRRLPSFAAAGTDSQGLQQADINGIPLSSIERIEVLPSSAGGVYGGGATGGVINIITKKDYRGLELGVSFGDTTRFDAAYWRLDAAGGLALFDGRTRLSFGASYQASNPLLASERDFSAKARALQLANNPDAVIGGSTPPVGATSNIRSQNGSNLVLDNGTMLNSPITYVPIGYAGPASDGGAALVGNAGSYNLELPDTGAGVRRSLLNNPTIISLTGNIRQEVGEHVELFGDVFWAKNDSHYLAASAVPTSVTLAANAPNNPFTVPVVVRYAAPGLEFEGTTRNQTVRLVGGAIWRLPHDWVLSADYAWSRATSYAETTNPSVGDPDGSGPGTSFASAVSSGTLDVLRDLDAFPLDYAPYLLGSPNLFIHDADTTLNDVTFRVAGPLLKLPGGKLAFTGLAEHRTEDASMQFLDRIDTSANGTTIVTPPRRQKVLSFYGELRAPLIGPEQGLSFLHSLELTASVRHDRYTTRAADPKSSTIAAGSPIPDFTFVENEVASTDYTLAGIATVVPGLSLRASYSTAFLPPSVGQLTPSAPNFFTNQGSLLDPKRGNTPAVVPNGYTLLSGGNPGLEPESSTSLSFGVVLQPQFIPGFKVSVDYTRIKKRNEISSVQQQQAIDFEDIYPERIIRDPLLPADAAKGYTAGIINTIDVSLLNFATTRLEAIDFNLDYATSLGEGWGDIKLYSMVSYEPTLKRTSLPGMPAVENAGYFPLKWRGNAGIRWHKGGWTLGWDTQYFGSTFVYGATASDSLKATFIQNQGEEKFAPQWYHDLVIGYRFAESSPLGDLRVDLGVQNVFDSKPRIQVAGSTNYITYADPRLRRFTLSLRKSF